MRRLSGRQREVVSYENRTTGGFFEKKTGHIYFKEDNLLHAISKLRYVQFHVDVVSTTRDRLQEFKNNAKSLNRQLQLVVAGACRRDSSWKT